MLLALCMTLACSQVKQDKEAVRQGVLEHVKKADINIGNMDVDVTSVQFRSNEADAVVSFRPKDAPNDGSMRMGYTLEAKDGKWVVKGKAKRVGEESHDGGMPQGGLPQGHPPVAPAPQQ